jgi:hypothetical protein
MDGGLFENGDLFGAMNHHVEPLLVNHGKLGGFEKAFQQDDGLSNARVAQAHGLFQPRHTQTVYTGGQGAGDTYQPVAVGIGLDDGHDAPAGSGFAYPTQVMPQGSEIYQRPRDRAAIPHVHGTV